MKEKMFIIMGFVFLTASRVKPSQGGSSVEHNDYKAEISNTKKVIGNGFEFELIEFKGWDVNSITKKSKNHINIVFNSIPFFDVAPQLSVKRESKLAKLKGDTPRNPSGLYYIESPSSLFFQAPDFSVTFESNFFSVKEEGLSFEYSFDGRQFFDRIIKTMRLAEKDLGFQGTEANTQTSSVKNIEGLLNFDDIEAIRKAALQFYEKSNDDHKMTFIDELKRGAIFESDQGHAIGSWHFRTHDGHLELVRQPPPPPAGEKQALMWYFGVQLEKKKNQWSVIKDFYMTEEWRAE